MTVKDILNGRRDAALDGNSPQEAEDMEAVVDILENYSLHILLNADFGFHFEKCNWCNGKGGWEGTQNVRGYPEDTFADCDKCGGKGYIIIEDDKSAK